MVRRPSLVTRSPCATMVATFCFRLSASRLVAPSAPSTPVNPTAAANIRTVVLTLTILLLILRPVGLTCTGHELEFPPFHQLFEDPELRLLWNVQHLVDGVVRLLHVGRRSRFQILQRLHLL